MKKRINNTILYKLSTMTNKLVISIIVLIFSSLLFSFKTYSWFNSNDQKKNSFQGSELVFLTEINELFTPNNSWKPSEKTVKEVTVKNTGTEDAFVRISLYEFLLKFQIDVSNQTANLKTVDREVLPIVDERNTDTWKSSAENHGTYLVNDTYYIADDVIASDPINKIGMYRYGSIDRANGPLQYINIEFSSDFTTIIPNEPSELWVYEDGYFYYLAPIKPGKTTKALIKKVDLSEMTPNSYQGSLYKLKVYMDAHDSTMPLLDEWKLPKDGLVHKVLRGQLR